MQPGLWSLYLNFRLRAFKSFWLWLQNNLVHLQTKNNTLFAKLACPTNQGCEPEPKFQYTGSTI